MKKNIDLGSPHVDRFESVAALLVGGGRAGSNILQIFDRYDWLHLHGLVDINDHAPGVQMARAMGIPTHSNVDAALSSFDGDMIIDATGDDKVAQAVMKACAVKGMESISGKRAKLLFHLAHSHVGDLQQIQAKSMQLELLKTMLHISQHIGSEIDEEELLAHGLKGSAKLMVSQKAIALEHNGEGLHVLGELGISNQADSLPEELAEELLTTLRNGGSEEVVALKPPLRLPNIAGEFRLAIPLFIDGELRYLLLFQIDEPPSKLKLESLKTLISHLQLVLEAENRHKVLQELAYRDPLTGVYNRRFFDERLREEVERFSRIQHGHLAVMFIDIDYFKELNDKLGHAAGDRVLTVIAKNIHQKLRSYDILARYGGDEFVAILIGVEKQIVQVVASRILSVMEDFQVAEVDIAGLSNQLGLSIGVAMAKPGATIDQQGLIDMADKALYDAKNHGRQQYQLVTYSGG